MLEIAFGCSVSASNLKSPYKRRFRFSLAVLLLAVLPASLIAILVRPYFIKPREWKPFSLSELHRQREFGRSVVVYFRDDWDYSFDRLQEELVTLRTQSAMSKRETVAMIANGTLNNPEAENELIRISGSKFIPAVAVYSADPKIPPILIEFPMNESSLLEVLSKIKK